MSAEPEAKVKKSITASENNVTNNKEQNRDIIKEMEHINQQIRDQPAYQKTIYWHQQASGIKDADQTDQFRQIMECLSRIEEKLDSMETMLKQ